MEYARFSGIKYLEAFKAIRAEGFEPEDSENDVLDRIYSICDAAIDNLETLHALQRP